MSRFRLLFLLAISTLFACQRRLPVIRPVLSNEAFDRRISRLIGWTAPVMSVEQLATITHKVHIFDARKRAEYEVSHLPNARFLGFPKVEETTLLGIPRQDTLVVYCSVGYRSEIVAAELRRLGYEQVYNLYGSLFEWVNRGLPVVDMEGLPTDKVHTFNQKWSKWVQAAHITKVW